MSVDLKMTLCAGGCLCMTYPLVSEEVTAGSLY